MIIKPKVRDYFCTTAHPDGCAENVMQQIAYTKGLGKTIGPKKVLILGASTGYGLATRIAATYGCDASTIGVMFERPATERRTATPGWYNSLAFERIAHADGYYAKSVNGDAFSAEVKKQVIDLIKEDFGKVDMVVYSLAAPRRTTADGVTHSSVLKTVGTPFTNKSLDLKDNSVIQVTVPPATEEEIDATIKVMGGEDWKDWITALSDADVLEEHAITLAYSYIGPEITHPIYYNGSIGQAKNHLYQTSKEITKEFSEKDVHAYISMNKALVTQASAAIPIVPLYITILYKIMKEKGIHEGCIEQMNRLFREKLNGSHPLVDDKSLIRLDDLEMREDVQSEVAKFWEKISSENVAELTDIDGYWEDFYHMFGFHFDQVDYEKDIALV